MGIQRLLDFIYPPQCMTCDQFVTETAGLCGTCWRDTHFINGLACDQCGAPLLGTDEASVRCDDCMASPPPWRQGYAPVLYAGNTQRIVMKLKYSDRTELSLLGAKWMATMLPDLEPETILEPVPLHWRRLYSRRYNQAAVLAQELAKLTKLTCLPDALIRKSATKPTDHLGREARFEMLADAIAPHPKRARDLDGRPVLLVDDVMTTGATLSACTQACFSANASQVDVIALARVAKSA